MTEAQCPACRIKFKTTTGDKKLITIKCPNCTNKITFKNETK